MENVTIDKITEKIIASAFKVSNTLGIGFVEKVYENAHAYHPSPSPFPQLESCATMNFINPIPFIPVYLRLNFVFGDQWLKL